MGTDEEGKAPSPPQSAGHPAEDALDPAGTSVLPPLPPAPAGQQVQLALGLALMQRSSFDRLPADTQRELMALADKLDQRQYEFALRSLEKEADFRRDQLSDNGRGRKQILSVIALITMCAVLAGTGITCWFIAKDQYSLAHTVMMSGLAVVSALLGGAGLSSIVQKMSGGNK